MGLNFSVIVGLRAGKIDLRLISSTKYKSFYNSNRFVVLFRISIKFYSISDIEPKLTFSSCSTIFPRYVSSLS